MPEHRSHGFPYVEAPRHDELPEGAPAAQSGPQKRAAGRFTAGDDGSAKLAGAEGGLRRKGTTKLSHRIDAPTLTPTSQRRARVLRRALAGELSATVGGGVCGVAASLFVKFAAQKTAAAEEAFAVGDFDTHRKLSESARMDVLYAREHAAKLAAARLASGDDFAAEVARADAQAIATGERQREAELRARALAASTDDATPADAEVEP